MTDYTRKQACQYSFFVPLVEIVNLRFGYDPIRNWVAMVSPLELSTKYFAYSCGHPPTNPLDQVRFLTAITRSRLFFSQSLGHAPHVGPRK